MNKIIKNPLAIIVIIGVTILTGCKKKEAVPVITTTAVSNITATTATSGGNITDEGSSTVITRGVCWSIGLTPTIADSKTTDGAGAGSFSSNITGLNGATVYYVRAYATNSAGTGYGMAMSFTTLGQAPTPVGAAATIVSATSATLNGSVNANYLSTEVTFEYGTTASYGSTITSIQSPVTGNSSTNVNAGISGLTIATIYHYRIKAVNSLGTTYSEDITFTTFGQVPNVSTQSATNITATGATLKGIVNANFLSSVVTFEYGITTSYGSTATATQNPVTGNTNTNVSASITGLAGGTIYHCRVKAVNSLGTTYGSDMTFNTLGQIPTAVTQYANNIQVTSTTITGSVNSNYLSTTVSFEYGITTGYGSTATATQSPITGSTNIIVSAPIIDLLGGTTYHFRVKAVNSVGTTYGSDVTFTTLGQIPTATTLAATNTTPIAAQLNGTINANYLESTVTFEYGITTNYGSIVSATQSPITGSTDTNVSVPITGLTYGTTYHFRIKAVNSLGTTYGNDITFIAAYVIGNNYAGGIIFFIDATGLHGLVCAATDQSAGAVWGCSGTTISGADGVAVGTGNQNTIDIVNGCSTSGIAAKICYDLVLNGYNDWFLPSLGEIGWMYTNLGNKGLGGFTNNKYWSSTEVDSNSAWPLYLERGGGDGLSDFKNKVFYVRAVRAF